MKKKSFKQRFQYWFDTRMSRGAIAMIKVLAWVTLAIVLLITAAILLFGFSEDGDFFTTFWDNMATVINAWMPYSSDGGPGYIILTAIVAIVGLMVTSVLIGLIGSAIEEKLTSLRKGNSVVLESGHIVILGFTPGEYELINQLILAAAGEPLCLVIAGDGERDEMEDLIHENVDIPRNVKIIYRSVDICDPVALKCCSITDAASLVVNVADDDVTIRSLLAVSQILRTQEEQNLNIVAAFNDENYKLPERMCKEFNIIQLNTKDIIARIIAHSSTQPGLSDAFTDVFNFEGSELYVADMPQATGLSFMQIAGRLVGGVPVGVYKDGVGRIGVDQDEILDEDEKIIFFAETKKSIHLESADKVSKEIDFSCFKPVEKESNINLGERIAIIGYNTSLDTVIVELPETIEEIIFADLSDETRSEVQQALNRRPDLNYSYYEEDIDSEEGLKQLIKKVNHIILLKKDDMDVAESDMDVMLKILKLREIRKNEQLSFNITAELQSESNRNLMVTGDPTDFIVASNISSMMIAQMVTSPELYGVFKELLSNEGTDLFLRSASQMGVINQELETAQLRKILLQNKYHLLGVMKNNPDYRETFINPDLHQKWMLDDDDCLILIGEQAEN